MKKNVSCVILAAVMGGNLWAAAPVEEGSVGLCIDVSRPSMVYAVGEEAVLTVTATNGSGAKVSSGIVEVAVDAYSEGQKEKRTVDLARENPFVVRGTLPEPGFLRFAFSGGGVRRIVRGVGFSPERIRPAGVCPADFDAFWADSCARLEREVPLDPRLTHVPERSTATYDFWRVSFATFGGQRVWGFLTVPKDKSKAPYPVRFVVSSAGTGRWTWDLESPRNQDEVINMSFTIHAFEPPTNQKDADRLHEELSRTLTAKYGDPSYAVAGLGKSREEVYFYRPILGINRAVNWLWSRPDVDRSRFHYQGGSQGGGLGMILLGLNRKFTAGFLHVPAMMDALGCLKGRDSGFPGVSWRFRDREDRFMALANMAYYNGAFFASRVTCPVRMALGFADEICPPTGIYAAYNSLTVKDKDICHGILRGHGWWPESEIWEKWLRKPAAAGAPATTVETLRARAAALVAKMMPEEKCAQLMNSAPAIERLGVPRYDWWSEALHGVARNGRATVFPEPIGMAASFDAELVREVAGAIADEGRAKYASSIAAGRRVQYAGLTFWSPNVNIFRDPRWGRGIETWGEDPYLTGKMGSAFVRGLQGDDPVYLKTAACAKHFAVHSGPEAKRHTFDACPSRKDFRETYLPAFEMCVREGKVEAVMGAYNRVYGESASASRLLLKDILRGEWGFAGHIVSDCGAVCDIWKSHKIVQTPPEAAALAIRNGLTFECGPCFRHLKTALDKGLVTEREVDEALVTLFTTRYRLGIMEDDPNCPYRDADPSCVCSAAHRALARKAARESMVLLKNDGVLPLDPKRGSYAVVGAGATDLFALMGNYYGVADRYVSYLEGISSAVDSGVGVFYHPGYAYGGGFGRNLHGGDVLVMVLGLTNSDEGEEGESFASETNGDRVSLKLPSNQLECLRAFGKIARQGGRKLVVVLTGGSPVELQEVEELADAVVMAWYAGEEGGTALADLLFGAEDFTGRLPITFPDSAEVLPPFEDYSMAGRTYRYQTRGVTHPFGYGLSYAKFSAGTVSACVPDAGDAKASVEVSNVSARDGVAVVQLYVSTPNAGKGAPLKSLVGFRRVPLKAGETRTVEFPVSSRQLMEFGEDGVPRRVPGACAFSVRL